MSALSGDSPLATRHAALVGRLRLQIRVAQGDASALEPAARALLEEEGELSPDDDLLRSVKSEEQFLLVQPGASDESKPARIRERLLEAVQDSGGLLVKADGVLTTVVHGNVTDADTLAVVRSSIDAKHSVGDLCRHGAQVASGTTTVMTLMNSNITGPLGEVMRCAPGQWQHQLDAARDETVAMLAHANPAAHVVLIDDVEPHQPEITRQRVATTTSVATVAQYAQQSQPQATQMPGVGTTGQPNFKFHL